MSVRRVSLAALAAVFLTLPPAWGDVFGTGAYELTPRTKIPLDFRE